MPSRKRTYAAETAATKGASRCVYHKPDEVSDDEGWLTEDDQPLSDLLPLRAEGGAGRGAEGAHGKNFAAWTEGDQNDHVVHPFEGPEHGEVNRDDVLETRLSDQTLPMEPIKYWELFFTTTIF